MGRLRAALSLVAGRALMCATAPDGSAKAAARRDLRDAVGHCSAAIAALSVVWAEEAVRNAEACRVVRGFDALHAGLGTDPDLDGARRFFASMADRVVPAVQAIMTSQILAEWDRIREAEVALQARNAEILSMCHDIEGIARTVRLVAVNAAVEAARAGGTSGQVFTVIAKDVRDLAGRAAAAAANGRAHLS
ncbi:methyl-accepting chemotaxis protein [Jannaschia sp. LMIT008]|uniref:methyl-accepting chemotaxis protein n=1 Tax=Jannaschia maritima TaxID=3032585 RepID=UPI00281277F2|nr:methyl-accepting chemotaxis protein [Jannaschia sp. LMIT008]